MGRTLRGFETEFPYLGDRGDTSDASIVAKEEAYGALSDRVVTDMFGDGDKDEDDYGRAMRHNPMFRGNEFSGTPTLPPGYAYSASGGLVRASTAPKAQTIHGAAQSAHAYLMSARLQPRSVQQVVNPWGESWQVTALSSPSRDSVVDRQLASIAHQHNTWLFKVRSKSGTPQSTYLFSRSPRSTKLLQRASGMAVQVLAKGT